MPAEVIVGGVHYQSLAEQGTVLGAADVESVGQSRQIRQNQVVFRGSKSGAKSGAVQEQEQAVAVTALPQGLQLSLLIDSADLRSVRDINQSGGHHVLRTVVLRQNRLNQRRRQLAVGGIDGADLVAGSLDSAGLMGVDMGGVRGDDRLIRLQERLNDNEVRLRAANQKMDVRVRRGTDLSDGLPGGLTAGVHAVADSLLQIRVHQCLEDLGMGTFTVIVAEAVHDYTCFLKSNNLLLKSYRESCINASRGKCFPQ